MHDLVRWSGACYAVCFDDPPEGIRAQMLRQTQEVTARAAQGRCQCERDTEFHTTPLLQVASSHVRKHYLTAGD